MRAHLSQGTELGIRSAEFINSDRLLPDEIITAVVRDHRTVLLADPVRARLSAYLAHRTRDLAPHRQPPPVPHPL
ncbi:hypothetical protein [Streptomyces sp. NPDC127038]|uniref:hypothetical protein n=1 Tax=Streptomyces sp. NPDC127038 TaxID=3347114 RepID=UPI0036547FD9